MKSPCHLQFLPLLDLAKGRMDKFSHRAGGHRESSRWCLLDTKEAGQGKSLDLKIKRPTLNGRMFSSSWCLPTDEERMFVTTGDLALPDELIDAQPVPTSAPVQS